MEHGKRVAIGEAQPAARRACRRGPRSTTYASGGVVPAGCLSIVNRTEPQLFQ
jgi:hypothetical protein